MQWSSPDTFIPDLYQSIDWNRYAYVRDNPLKYVDTSGYRPDDGCRTEGCSSSDEKKAEDNGDSEVPFDTSLGGNKDELTDGQLIWRGLVIGFVEITVIAPFEVTLIVASVSAAAGGPESWLLEAVLVPADIVVADLGISLLLKLNKEIETRHEVDMQWTIIPAIVSDFPKPVKDFFHDIVPGVIP